ncbi:MAG TPA: hypothetical protein VKY89_14780, partial [Thermoanaerobaculia bacterium]|nr:hypothetical protein [Thermoanaerobaculia bacterium]
MLEFLGDDLVDLFHVLGPGSSEDATPATRRSRFASHLDLTDHGVMPQRFGHELVMTNLRIAFYLLDGVQNMPEVERVTAHNGSASATTRSR